MIAISLPSSKFFFETSVYPLPNISCFIINYGKPKCKLFFYFIILIILSENVSKSIVSQFLTKITIQRFLKWQLFVLDYSGQCRKYPSTRILVAALYKTMFFQVYRYQQENFLIDIVYIMEQITWRGGVAEWLKCLPLNPGVVSSSHT